MMLDQLTDEEFIRQAYGFLLRRDPDPGGLAHFLGQIAQNGYSRTQVLNALVASDEFQSAHLRGDMISSLHEARRRFIRQLPRAKSIVDLGGSAQNSDRGAFVELGYPYNFERLTIVDLPIGDRHELYQNNDEVNVVETELGPVHYMYQSMTDLIPFDDNSVDLVYSGQSIEHVTEADGTTVINEVFRILRPGGHFCLDTPNGRITRIQQDAFIDPDHDVEYTHQQLSSKLVDGGFELAQSVGLNYAGNMQTRADWNIDTVARNCGLYDAIEDCYLLAYVCRKPAHA